MTSGIILTLLLATSDYEQSDTSRRFSEYITEKYPINDERNVWIANDFGLRYYLVKQGYPFFIHEKNLQKNDLILRPEIAEVVLITAYLPEEYAKNKLELVERKIYDGKGLFRLTDTGGWYHSGPGPLPYTFPRNPPMIFGIYRVLENYTYDPIAWGENNPFPDT